MYFSGIHNLKLIWKTSTSNRG